MTIPKASALLAISRSHGPGSPSRHSVTSMNPTPGMEHGVACDMCHRIADIDISKPNFPGIYPGVVTLTRPVGPNEIWKVMYGVLGDADFYQRGWMRASYQPQLKSEVCAACHQDKNDPDLSGDFESEDAIISEPTYLEWLDSDYADPSSDVYAECVDCHMPATGAAAACDRVGFTRPDGDVRSHNILGTTPEYLENALTMTMDASIEGDSLMVDVAIENDRTGHSVPTGVTIRNMILLVEAWQASDGAPLEHTGGPTVHALGGVGEAGPEEGYYAGLPGRLYGKINIARPGSTRRRGGLADVSSPMPWPSSTTTGSRRSRPTKPRIRLLCRPTILRSTCALVSFTGAPGARWSMARSGSTTVTATRSRTLPRHTSAISWIWLR